VEWGVSQRPVNYPIRARSAKDTANWIGFSEGKAISGMAFNFLTNFGGGLETFFFPWAFTRRAKAASSADGGGGAATPPPTELISADFRSNPSGDHPEFDFQMGDGFPLANRCATCIHMLNIFKHTFIPFFHI